MHGFLSRDGMPLTELLAAGRNEVTGYGVELVSDQVVGIDAGFSVRLAGGRLLRARRVLVATGVGDELPDIPGVRRRWGRDLLHCPYCHGWEVRDQPLGVLGSIAGSVQHALLARQWSDNVVFFAHTYELTDDEQAQLDARGVQIERGTVTQLTVEHDELRGVELSDGRAIARSAVFVRPGNGPHGDGCSPGSTVRSTTPASPPSTPPGEPVSPACGLPATSSIPAPRSSPQPAPARRQRSPSTPTSSKRTWNSQCSQLLLFKHSQHHQWKEISNDVDDDALRLEED